MTNRKSGEDITANEVIHAAHDFFEGQYAKLKDKLDDNLNNSPDDVKKSSKTFTSEQNGLDEQIEQQIRSVLGYIDDERIVDPLVAKAKTSIKSLILVQQRKAVEKFIDRLEMRVMAVGFREGIEQLKAELKATAHNKGEQE